MSINLFALAWQISFPGKPAKKLVLLSLADSTNASHEYTWPSYDTIAERCGISRRAVINAVNELEAEGIVKREARYKAGNLRTSNAFRINERLLRDMAAANAKAFINDAEIPPMVNSVHHNGELISPRSEHSSPPMVNTVHPYGEHSSPKPELEPEDRTRMEPERGNGAFAPPAPASAPNVSSHFRPVPENVKKAKLRRGDTEPESAMITAAPAAVQLVSRLTNSWPGEHLTADLVALFGENPDEATLTEAVRQWRLAGFRMTNYGGIGEWYQELIRDPTWTPGTRFKRNGNLKSDPIAREAHNRAVFEQVAQEINTGDWTPWITDSNT